ncbi:MAG: acetyl-CoA C-acyltransferase [Haloplanus sp.]
MTPPTEVVLVDAARTPHGSFLGGLADVPAPELGATALAGLLDRTPVAGEAVEWVVLGNVIRAGVGQVPARQVVLRAGLPESTPATTVDEASGSGLRALTLAADRIDAGRADVAVAGGTESMSNAPYLLSDHRRGHRLGDDRVVDALVYDALWDAGEDAHMGTITDEFAARFDIDRETQDEYARRSHERASETVETGAFDAEVVPVSVGEGVVADDEGPRPETTLDRLAALPPAFGDGGTVTAGNASDLADGAGCVLVTSAAAAADAGVEAPVCVADYAVAYRDPTLFGMAVADAVQRLLRANDLRVEDVGHFELNEAFAAQTCYVRDRLGIPDDRLNPRGGAVALGHPIGASGGMLTATLLSAMREAGHRYGVVGMSVGGGGGIAVLLEA